MKRISDYTRELASGINDLNTRRISRAEAGLYFVIRFTAVMGLGIWWLVEFLRDCGGATC